MPIVANSKGLAKSTDATVSVISSFVPHSKKSTGSPLTSQLLKVGYRGSTVESVIKALLDRTGGDARKAERGIVFIDEIDKIRCGETGMRDVSGEGVQNALLTLLDGRLSTGEDNANHPAVDTDRLLFICTGAFVGLDEIVRNRMGTGRSTMGFHVRPNEKVNAMPDRPVYEALCQAQTADLVAYGMIPEFIGRFATVSVLHELSRADLRAIIGGDTERSPLVLQQKLAAVHGIELVMTKEALDALADEAEALGTGARGLARLIGKAMDPVDHRWPDLADQGVRKVVIGADVILKGAEPLLETKGRVKKRLDAELRKEAASGLPPRPSPVLSTTRSEDLLQPGISDTRSWSDEQVWNEVETIKNEEMDWKNTTGSARTWWETFEKENRHRAALILRLLEELKVRKASINEFSLSYVYSNTDNIQANLYYLDYSRLKKEEDGKKKKAG